MRWDWCCGSWRPVALHLMVRMHKLLFLVDHFDIKLCSYISYLIVQIWLTFEFNLVWQHSLITQTNFWYFFLLLGLLNKPVTVSGVSWLLSIIGVWSNGTILIRCGQWSRPQGLLWQGHHVWQPHWVQCMMGLNEWQSVMADHLVKWHSV